MDYRLDKAQLMNDLWRAYYDARRHKRNKDYQQRFESNAEANLQQLRDELWERQYKPQPSTCFLISDPKRREVFAAQFRDRIVHHLYFNYVHVMLERTYIADSYSCIKHRGTHYGINRLERCIRRESQNYREKCYVLKMDIRGYFMHINRQRLLDITLRQLSRQGDHKVNRGVHTLWREVVDMEFVAYLTRVIVMQDPTADCVIRGYLHSWLSLPREKSLFYSPKGCGLPIGNLTSQLFSNVYLNEFDQFVKRQLKCKSYGRYVDDFFVVSADRDWLLSLRWPMADFLRRELGLEVNNNKTTITDVCHGVGFLGAFLMPGRRYVSNSTLRRMKRKIPLLKQKQTAGELAASINSMLGVLGHYRSYGLRRKLFLGLDFAYDYGYYVKGMRKYVLYPI